MEAAEARRRARSKGDRMDEAHAQAAEHGEQHGDGLATRLNWLRAAVLGANDGVVSTAGLVVGVAGATSARGVILTAGLAGMFAAHWPWRRVSTYR